MGPMTTDIDADGALLNLLRRDPLAEAEQALGYAMSLNQQKSAALKAAHDTHWGISLEEYIQIVTDEGFSLALKEPFTCDGKQDSLYVFWHPEGILLVFDSYRGEVVNGGHFCYNWRPHSEEEWFDKSNSEYHVTSSGSWESGPGDTPKSQWVWVGSHDCREALRLNLRELRRCGYFVCPWVKRPWLWLLNYADTKVEGYDYEAINAKRIAMLPKDVQEAIRA